MAQSVTYTVKFPDGQVQTFDGPDGMTDSDAFARASQERGVKEGKIQTTWFGGAAKQMGQEKAANAAIIGGAGTLTGTAPMVALAPLASTWIDYLTKRFTGEKPTAPSLSEQASDVAMGAAGAYGPQMIAGAAEKLAASTVAHQLPNGQWVRGLSGPGVGVWAAKTAAEGVNEATAPLKAITPEALGKTAKDVIEAAKQAGTRTLNGVSADEVNLVRESVKLGMNPTVAARTVAAGNPKAFSALMALYRRPAVGLVK